MCNYCNSTPCCCPGPCRYNGPAIDCLGITPGMTYDQIIEIHSNEICDILQSLGELAGIDNVAFTSSSLGGAAGQPGATDTYTIWADVGQTISLGTFEVYNGTDGTDGVDGVSGTEQVFYSEQALGAGSVGTSPTRSVITGTAYTIPVGGDGDYKIDYNVDVNLGDGASDVSYAVYVNAVLYSVIERNIVEPDIGVQHSSITLSNISLTEGDVIDIRGESNSPSSHYLINGVCIIEKIS